MTGSLAAPANSHDPAVSPHNLVGHPQSESSAGLSLGGDERLEDSGQQFPRDAGAGVS